jgi:hypothetical protein
MDYSDDREPAAREHYRQTHHGYGRQRRPLVHTPKYFCAIH